MRTVTEKYRGVLEGKMSKKEFLRQMRLQHPQHITQFNGFDDTVQILKNRRLLYEEGKATTGVSSYDNREDLNVSLDAIDRGIRVELENMGVDIFVKMQTREEYEKAKEVATKNLKNNPTYYIDLLAGESDKVNKNDKAIEVKRGQEALDTLNQMKKANLQEGFYGPNQIDTVVTFGYELDMIQQVVDHLQNNYKEGEDFELHIARGDDLPNAVTLKNPNLQKDYELNDMLNAAQSDEDRYDAYTEGGPDQGGDLDVGHQDDEPNMLQKDLYDIAHYAAKLHQRLKKYDAHDGEVDFPHWWQKKVILAREYISSAQHYLEAEENQPAMDQLALESVSEISLNKILKASIRKLKETFPNIPDETLKEFANQYMNQIQEGGTEDVVESFVNFYESKKQPKTVGVLEYTEPDTETSSDGYIESMGPELDSAIEHLVRVWKEWKSGPMTEPEHIKPAKKELVQYIYSQLDKTALTEGKSLKRKAEVKLKEAIKGIIKKVLTEDKKPINEAATGNLSQITNDYTSFSGMQNSINQLENIVTDIESYYSKLREKLQKIYQDLGNIENEDGMKVGAYIAPSIEAAFMKDLRPVMKKGFTSGLELPKSKVLTKADIEAQSGQSLGEEEIEEKQTLFTPVSEQKNKK